jgi:hypothetical protein
MVDSNGNGFSLSTADRGREYTFRHRGSTDRYALRDLGVASIPLAITIILEENPATEL